MSSIVNKLSKVSRSRLKRLFDKVNDFRKAAMSEQLFDELKSLNSEERRKRLVGFFAMQNFNAEALKAIEKHVFAIDYRKIRKLIYYGLIMAVIGYISVSIWTYQKMTRVYAIGDNISLYDTADNNVMKGKMMLFLTDTSPQLFASDYMIKINDSTQSKFLVKQPGLFKHLFNSAIVYQIALDDTLGLTNSFDTIRAYQAIFQAIKSEPELSNISTKQRVALFKALHSPDYEDAIFSNEYKKTENLPPGYSPVLSFQPPATDSSYLYGRLFKPNVGDFNFVFRCGSNADTILKPNRIPNNPLVYKKDGTYTPPIIDAIDLNDRKKKYHASANGFGYTHFQQ